jgi:hypothetical protein
MGTDLPSATAPIGAVERRKRCVIDIFRAASGTVDQVVGGPGPGAVYGPGTRRVKVDERRWVGYDG